jgi:DMSO/TMAO reductase YedYZ heme-binding membrane subunit
VLRIPGAIPFEWFGLAAFLILFVMASTSHDFWQKALGASAWKWLHMLVYPMYGLLVLHVLFGALRSETATAYAILLGGGFTVVAGLSDRRPPRTATR